MCRRHARCIIWKPTRRSSSECRLAISYSSKGLSLEQLCRRYLIIFIIGVCAVSSTALAQKQSNSTFTVHVVQRGENLFRIALQYDLFAEQVAEANGITDSNSITVGQRLIIPLATTSSDQRLTHTVPPARRSPASPQPIAWLRQTCLRSTILKRRCRFMSDKN